MLSPCLFNFYIDDLLKELCTSGCGAKVTNAYVACLAYVDDILLFISNCDTFAKIDQHL